MRGFLIALVLPVACMASILPDTMGEYHRGTPSKPGLTDAKLWDEFGLKEAETAAYSDASTSFQATAWRLQDSTGAMAAFQWQRPADSTVSNAAPLAVVSANNLLLAQGNYLLLFQGHVPSAEELDGVLQGLRNVDTTSLPPLRGYLPSQDLVPNSERYIVGPVGLERFAPAISPSIAAFHYSAEAQTGVFHSPKGNVTLAIFNYPTPQIAMQQTPEFEKIPNVMAKRSGPLVAVVLSPPDPDYAERLLSGIRYQAAVTRDEYVPTRRDNIGNLVVNAFVLIGILLACSVAGGLAMGGFRLLRRRGHKGEEPDAMITLHLR